jgi:pentatricopeptide repeat protein
VIQEIDQLIDELRNDSNLTIQQVIITGYASPEGASHSNYRLSENRAKAFADFLANRYAISREQLFVNWKGEDWEGLERVLENAPIPDNDLILSIIQESEADDLREQKLKGLGSYPVLLKDYYPLLRRNELNINFIVKAFNLDEAKIILRTNPQYLSLNEMYLLANSYAKGSKEFNEVFNIASRMYPKDPVAQFNAATADIESGSFVQALNVLEKIDRPDAWNNLAIIYAKRGELIKAAELFEKAVRTECEPNRITRCLLVF